MAKSRLKRTTISLSENLFEGAQDRMGKLRYQSFSDYVQYLIQADLDDRPQHLTVREEGSIYHTRKAKPAEKNSGGEKSGPIKAA